MTRTTTTMFWTLESDSQHLLLRKKTHWKDSLAAVVLFLLFLSFNVLMAVVWRDFLPALSFADISSFAKLGVLLLFSLTFIVFTVKTVIWLLFSILNKVTILCTRQPVFVFQYFVFSFTKMIKPKSVVIKSFGTTDEAVYYAWVCFDNSSQKIPLAYGFCRSINTFISDVQLYYQKVLERLALEIVVD